MDATRTRCASATILLGISAVVSIPWRARAQPEAIESQTQLAPARMGELRSLVVVVAPRSALAMIEALDAYEGSIESMQWEQKEYHPPSPNQNRRDWVLLEDSKRYVDASWRSFHESTMLGVQPPDCAINYHTGVYIDDGCFSARYGPDADQGMLTFPDHFSAGGCNVWRMLGRCTDYEQPMFSQPLASYLRIASLLTWLDPTDEEPWPGVRAEGAISRGWMNAEVRLDPEHGFAPRIIRIVRPSDGLVVETFVILRYTFTDGVWAPSLLIHGANYADTVEDPDAPLPQTHRDAFLLARCFTGLPQEAISAEVASWINRLLRVEVLVPEAGLVAGPFTCMNPDEALAAPAITTVTSIRVNQPVSWNEMFRSIPTDARMFNGLTGEWITGARARRVFLDLKEGQDAP